MVVDKRKYSINSLSKKKVKKPLDISPKISDNITNDEVIDIATSDEKETLDTEVDNETEFEEDNDVDETFESKEDVESVTQEEESIEEVLTPEEIKEVKKKIQREINTQAIKRDGWLDDVDNKR